MNLEEEINKDALKMAWAELQERIRRIKLGGGKARLKKLNEQGKLSARERINQLVDNPNEVFEVGILAAEKMYEEHGGCPAAGVVVVIAHVAKKRCVIVANDATVKAGAWFPMTAKKNLRAQEIAWKIKFLLSTWLIVLEYTFPFKMKFLLIKRTLGEFLEIMQK